MHNSYKSPDSINAIDWTLLDTNADQNEYYRQLIALRKAHPAFRMTTAGDIAKNLVFDKVTEPNVISYSLKNHANGDEAAEIKLVFNGNEKPVNVKIPKGKWTIVARDGKIDAEGLKTADGVETTNGGLLTVEPTSALILIRK